jgi:hypothetical protein
MLTEKERVFLNQLVSKMTPEQMANYLGVEYLRECVFSVADENRDFERLMKG